MGNGAKFWILTCDVCGEEYRVTNFDCRLARTPEGNIVQASRHKAKCKGWTLLTGPEAARERRGNRPRRKR